ncbi:MAG: hypothetical protein H7249_04165 [Chitinophagaceae bacterium]|nr:hypothetical protein [Oligoflexus sp.]
MLKMKSQYRRWAYILGWLTMAFVSGPKASAKGNIALIYRGPAACDGCAEAAADMVKQSGQHLEVHYIGPDEDLTFSDAAFANAVLYVQPGGGDNLDETYEKDIKPYRAYVRNFIKNGGRYLGICMGGYLAGQPGFDLIPGIADQYIRLDHAQVKHSGDTVVEVKWGDHQRTMFFQDGPFFKLSKQGLLTSKTQVLARYASLPNDDSAEDAIAAMIAPFYQGKVAVIGPHPEATGSWYRESQLKAPLELTEDISLELILALLK